MSATIDETPNAGAQLTFWQHPFVQNILPFLTSLTLHAGLILIAWMGLKAVQALRPQEVEQITVAESEIIDGAPVGGVKNPGLGGDPNRRAEQDKFPEITSSEGWSDKKSDTLSTSLLGGGGGANDAGGMIALGAGGGFGSGGGVGTGKGVGIGSGSGDGSGPLAPFGVPGGGGGLGPKANFVGVSGNARRIAYVCDASGSMMNKFDSLRVELRRAVDILKPIQSFTVIFFQEDKAAFIEKSLIAATPENKRKSYEFLDNATASGRTDPIPGLRLAFDASPQLIFLLTDGDFPDNEAVVKYIAERNGEKKVKVNTIAFVGRGEEYEKVLRKIAEQNGGVFKYVSEDDLGR